MKKFIIAAAIVVSSVSTFASITTLNAITAKHTKADSNLVDSNKNDLSQADNKNDLSQADNKNDLSQADNKNDLSQAD